MSATYPNPIEATVDYNLGEPFIFHANPELPALKKGDDVILHIQDHVGYTVGRAKVVSEVGPNTYRARRYE